MSEIIPSEQVAPEPVEAPAEEPWSGPSAEEWESVTQALGYMAQQFQQPQEQPTQGPSFDPFSDDPGTQIRDMIRQELAPVQQYQYGQSLAEAEERAYDILDDIVTREGEFIDQEKAYPIIRALADRFVEEEAQRRGFGPQAAEAALARAAKTYRELEQIVGKSAIEKHMNQLTNLSGASREPSATGTGAQQYTSEAGADELALVRQFGGFPGS